MDASSLTVDFGNGALEPAARQAKKLYDEHGCFLARNLFPGDQLSPIKAFAEALVDAIYADAGLTRPPGRPFQESIVDLAKIDRKLVSRLYDAGPRMLAVHELAVDRRMVALAKAMIGTE